MTMAEAIASARAESELRRNAGFDQTALDNAARQGFAAGAFEESEEEGAAVVEEFYHDEFDSGDGALGNAATTNKPKPGLADKLNEKAARMNGQGRGASTGELSGEFSRQVQHGRA